MEGRIAAVGAAPMALRGWSVARVPVLLLIALLASACATSPSVPHARAHVRAGLGDRPGGHLWVPGQTLVLDLAGLSDRDRTTVHRAFDMWLAGESGPRLYVREARPGEVADVEFRLVDRVSSGRDAMGRTRLEWTGVWLDRAVVELGRRGRRGAVVTAEERRRTIVHEIGHVLGLGHSERFSSIMHPRTPGCTVDDTDRLALAVLYAEHVPVAVSARVLAARGGEEEEEDEEEEDDLRDR